MQEYKLEIRQSVDYPRCRIYREFVQSLIADKDIRVNGESLLFHFTVLCSYSNFRTAYRRLYGISYTVYGRPIRSAISTYVLGRLEKSTRSVCAHDTSAGVKPSTVPVE